VLRLTTHVVARPQRAVGHLLVVEHRRGHPRMLAAQLHVGEARLERRAQLLGLVLVQVVGVAGRVDAAVRRGQGQDAVRRQHPRELAQHRVLLLDVLDDLEAHDEPEAPVVEGQRVDVADHEGGVVGRAGPAASTDARETSMPHRLGGARARRAARCRSRRRSRRRARPAARGQLEAHR
jgi:hypothetical protein